MRRRIRRIRANIYYLRQPTMDFLPLVVSLFVLLIVGSLCFHHLYRQEELTYIEALYITWCLVFMEHLIPFPEHWLLQLFYFMLPPLGLVVILDGFVRFGYYVLKRDESGEEWVRAMVKTYSGHVILCGLGRVGLRVLQQLIRLGEDTVVLEKNPDNQNLSYARKHRVPVLIGSGREEGIINDLNVVEAKSVILATDDDLANLEIALDARKAKPDIHVVMRMFDQELASKIRDAFDIQLAFSTAAQAAPLFATSSSDRTIINSFYIDEQLMVVAKFEITPTSELIGKTVGDIAAAHPVFILSHGRGGQVNHFPPASTRFEPGDSVTVQTEPEILKKLHHQNRDGQT